MFFFFPLDAQHYRSIDTFVIRCTLPLCLLLWGVFCRSHFSGPQSPPRPWANHTLWILLSEVNSKRIVPERKKALRKISRTNMKVGVSQAWIRKSLLKTSPGLNACGKQKRAQLIVRSTWYCVTGSVSRNKALGQISNYQHIQKVLWGS